MMMLRMTIIYKCALYIACSCLSLLGSHFASANSLVLEYPESEQYVAKIFERVQHEGVLDRLETTIQKNFVLKHKLTLKFYEGHAALFNDLDNTSFIPQSYLIELKEGLASTYPEQSEVRNNIFDAALVKLIWVEFGRALVSQYSIPLTGNEDVLLDEFSTLMMLSSDVIEPDYLLDAAEYLLLVDRSRSILEGGEGIEAKMDEQRYRHIVCLVLGHDYEPFKEKVKEVTWDEERLQGCERSSGLMSVQWRQRLTPALREESLLHVDE